MYFVYILKNQKFKKSYVGITNNLKKRLEQHNSGYHPYSKRYVPWKMIYNEIYNDRPQARKREIYLKTCAGRKWLKKNIFKIK